CPPRRTSEAKPLTPRYGAPILAVHRRDVAGRPRPRCSRPAGGRNMSQISGYRAALLARIRQITDDLEWILGEVGVNDLHQRPTIDDWSIHEHVAHVRDMDREVIVPLLRWATIPDMLGPRPYSRKEWRERRYDDGEPVAMILGDIRRMREEE